MKVSTFICRHCKKKRLSNPRLKGEQKYCAASACQRARKANWKRDKIRSDPDFAEAQHEGNDCWRRNQADYWKRHRQKKPEQADRNRLLQRKRNALRRLNPSKEVVREMVDASMSVLPDKLPKNGEYWLIPLIAKVDALKVNLEIITG